MRTVGAGQPAGRRGHQQRQQRLVDQRQDHLRFRIAQPHVELDHLRARRRQHQADVEESAKRMPFRRHAGDHRVDDLAHDPRVAAPRRSADSAQRRPSRRCSARGRRRRCACDPARCRSARRATPSQRTKNDTSGPVRHSSITRRAPAAPNRRSRHRVAIAPSRRRRDRRRSRRLCRPRDRRLSARPESRTRRIARTASASSSDVAGAEARGRHAVPRHERLRERLARSRAARPPAVGPNSSRPAAAKRSATPTLSGSSGPTTVRSICSRSASASSASGRRDVDGDGAGQGGDARVPGRGHNLGDVAIGGQPGDQRVLARAAAENENSHRLE